MTKLSRRSFVLFLGAGATTGAAGLGAATFWGRAQVSSSSAKTLTPEQALSAAQAGEILLVDIRRPEEWARTGIGAPAKPLDMRDPAFIQKLMPLRAFAEQPVALICAGGVRSARLAKRLNEAGIAPLIDIPEGMMGSSAGPGWIKRGLPLTQISDS